MIIAASSLSLVFSVFMIALPILALRRKSESAYASSGALALPLGVCFSFMWLVASAALAHNWSDKFLWSMNHSVDDFSRVREDMKAVFGCSGLSVITWVSQKFFLV